MDKNINLNEKEIEDECFICFEKVYINIFFIHVNIFVAYYVGRKFLVKISFPIII